MNYRNCSKCNIDKVNEDFNLKGDKRYPNLRRRDCKECQKVVNANYYSLKIDKEFTCKCGLILNESNKYEHVKSKKHIRRMDILLM